MISRIVHKHLPEDQYNHSAMKKYILLNEENYTSDDTHHFMDIDNILS